MVGREFYQVLEMTRRQRIFEKVLIDKWKFHT